MRNIFIDLFEPEIQERERKAAEAAAKVATEAAAKAATMTAYTTVAERLINKGFYGPDIADATGYDRSHIDSIAQRLNRTVQWNESRA